MNLTTRRREGVTLVDLDGKLTAAGGSAQFQTAIRNLLDNGVRQILINMEGVTMMDSSGLGELVRSKSNATRAGATIRLLHVEDKVREVFELARQMGSFETYDDEIDAIASFRG